MADAFASGGAQRGSEYDRTAEDFPVLKKYLRDDGSVFLFIEGRPVDVESHSPLDDDAYESIFQICEIKVLELGEEKSAQIYGKIHMQYPYGVWVLYDRKRENPETIELPGEITTTPPIVGIMPYDRLWIRFDMEGGLEDMEEKVVWWLPEEPRYEIMIYRLRGPGCCMEVSFIAFVEAVLADMVIDLPNVADDEGIYGSITVSYRGNMSDVGPLFMFNKKREDSVHVGVGKRITLTRPFIAVPYNNGLVIMVNLQTISGVPIAGGGISIRPLSLGKWFGILERPGEIQVRAEVEFFPYRNHPATRASEVRQYSSL